MKKRNQSSLSVVLVIVVIAIFTMTFTGCNLSGILEQAASSASQEEAGGDKGDISEETTGARREEDETEEAGNEQNNPEEVTGTNFKIAYFEVSSAENSTHFEHRVAEIYAINPDGSEKELIYTDLEEKYDLSRIYHVSPDYSKIDCGFYEGGRGAYGALAVIAVLTGTLKKLVEFDYTNDESQQLLTDIYGSPIWTNDGKGIAYEIISQPFTSNFRDAGIYTVDIETGEKMEVGIGIEGLSARSTTFLNPVILTDGDGKIFAIERSYIAKEENGEVLGYSSRNEKLFLIDISNESMEEILTVGDFENELSVFENFNLLADQGKLIFHVLGDFEEDGDIWVCNTDGSGLAQITSDTDLREQQPSIFEDTDGTGKVAYIGSGRYGTISSQIPSGDVYLVNIDGSDNKKLTDYVIGCAKPIISPDGRFIAFINHIYGENQENIETRRIEVFDTETNQTTVLVEGSGIFDLVGWITGN